MTLVFGMCCDWISVFVHRGRGRWRTFELVFEFVFEFVFAFALDDIGWRYQLKMVNGKNAYPYC